MLAPCPFPTVFGSPVCPDPIWHPGSPSANKSAPGGLVPDSNPAERDTGNRNPNECRGSFATKRGIHRQCLTGTRSTRKRNPAATAIGEIPLSGISPIAAPVRIRFSGPIRSPVQARLVPIDPKPTISESACIRADRPRRIAPSLNRIHYPQHSGQNVTCTGT